MDKGSEERLDEAMTFLAMKTVRMSAFSSAVQTKNVHGK